MSTFLRVFVFLAMAFVLTGCGGEEDLPTYPDIRKTIGPAEAAALADVKPVFGEQLVSASGRYLIVEGSVDVVQRWYDRLVAEQTVQYFSESRTNEGLHTLYRTGGTGPYSEIVITPIDSSSSMLVVYEDTIKRAYVSENGNWFRRSWGWLLRRLDRPAEDYLFDLLTGTIRPIRGFYELVWLKPILNLLLALRWMMPLNYVLIIILFVFIQRPVSGIVESISKRIFGTSSLGFRIRMILLFVLTSVFVAAAVWETLNGFYDVSPSGQSWIQNHVYDFWSANVKSFALLPPGKTMLWMRLDRPSVVFVPLLVIVLSIFIKSTELYAGYTALSMVTEEDVRDNSELASQVEIAKQEIENIKEDPGSTCQNVVAEPVLAGAALAFMPLGVSLYFVFDKIIDAIDLGLIGWQTLQEKENQTKNPQDRSYKASWIRLLLRVGVVLVVLFWLIVVDRGGLFRFDANSRVVGLFKSPAPNEISIAQTTTPTLTIATSTIRPTDTPIPSPTSTLVPTATATPTATPKPILAIVIADALNMRSGPGTQFSVVTVLPNDLELQVIARNEFGDWLSVSYEDETGWVAGDFLQIEGGITDIPISIVLANEIALNAQQDNIDDMYSLPNGDYPPTGRFHGSVGQESSSYSVMIDLDNCVEEHMICGKFEYPQLHCDGELEYLFSIGSTRRMFHFAEYYENYGSCLGGGAIKLQHYAGRQWKFEWYHPGWRKDNWRLGAKGILTADFDPTPTRTTAPTNTPTRRPTGTRTPTPTPTRR